MIKGKERKERLSIEEILHRTNGGYQIFKLYLGKVERIMQRPWGKRESKLSWGIFSQGRLWFWKDLASEESGTAIQFTQRYFNLTVNEAKEKICSDLGLLGGSPIIHVPLVVEQSPREYVDIRFSEKPFGKKHI